MTAAYHPVLVLAAVLAIAAPHAAAQLYKWTDENGTVNYSNTPPGKKPGAKPPVVVEEKISTYTPEKAVTDSIEAARARAAAPPPPPPAAAPAPAAGYAPPPLDAGGNRVGVIGPPPASQQQQPGYDPCLNPNDPRCQQVIYSAPVGVARRPGAVGGPVTSTVGPGTQVVPGQPGLNNPQFPGTTPRSPVMHRPDERDSFRR